MELLFAPFVLFQAQPWLALAPAVAFLVLWQVTRRRTALAAAIGWLVYTIHEAAIATGLTCSEDCSMRVDLLLIAPLLLGFSLVALLLALRRTA